MNVVRFHCAPTNSACKLVACNYVFEEATLVPSVCFEERIKTVI